MMRITSLFEKRNSGLKSSLKILLACLITLGFNSTLVAQYTVGGNAATLANGCFRLTQGATNKAGYVYNSVPINLNDTINFKFRINLGSTNAQGADGIMFVLRDSLVAPLIGSNGGALGFDASSMTTNSLGIEVDTYQNSGDPSSDHIGIQKNGSVAHTGANVLAAPVQALAGNNNIEDGNYHTMHIKWNPSTQKLKVYLDCSMRVMYTGDLINNVFGGDAHVYWGFLGTTSSLFNLQQFCIGTPIDSVSNPLPATINMCKGDTVQLDAGDNGVNYLWSPGLGLSGTNIKDPMAYPPDTTKYKVRRIYQCDTNYDSVIVQVIPPNFQINGLVTNASCKNVCDGEIDLTIGGGTGTYAYNWNTSSTSQDLQSLCDDMYIVTVQDVSSSSPNYLCYRIDTFFVTEPTLLGVNIINETKTKCPKSSNCDAEARAIPTGGTVPYSYHWTGNENVQQAMTLCAGWNFVTVTDNKGCTAIDSVEIEVPDTIITTGYGDTMICINSVAAIVAASSGGTPPFSYIWHKGKLNGPVVSISSADAVTPSVTTTYFVESYDGNGCFGDTSKVEVKVRPPLDIDFTHVDTICPYDTIDISAIGIGGDSIYSFAWEIGNFGPNIIVSPDETRYYVVTVTDFCGTPYAIDSVKVQVGGYDDIRASIRVEDDSICAGKSIYMIATGKGGFHGPQEFIFTWQFNQSHDNVQFIRPLKTTKYVVKIEDKCLSKPGWDTLVVYVGDTAHPTMSFTPPIACKQADVVISIDDYNARHNYTWIVDTFDVYTDYQYDSLNYRFANAGCYDFTLLVETDFGCKTQVPYECAIEILRSPKASFVYEPLNPSNIQPFLTFTNTSTSGKRLYWTIDRDTMWNDTVMSYEFYEREDQYQVDLFVLSEQGCLDSARVFLDYKEETIIYYPNSFSPNGDGDNDLFFVLSEGVQLKDFNLEIYNRWGEQVFRTVRQTQGWDGRNPGGALVPIGTYHFIMHYRDDENIERVIQDEINIAITGEVTGF